MITENYEKIALIHCTRRLTLESVYALPLLLHHTYTTRITEMMKHHYNKVHHSMKNNVFIN